MVRTEMDREDSSVFAGCTDEQSKTSSPSLFTILVRSIVIQDLPKSPSQVERALEATAFRWLSKRRCNCRPNHVGCPNKWLIEVN